MRLGRTHTSISFAVRFAVLGYYLGLAQLALAALMAVPALVCLAFGEGLLALTLAGLAAVYAGGGAVLSRLHAPDDLQQNEALVLLAAVFVFVAALTTIVFGHAGLAPIDALFEATAAVTTAGLSTIDSVERLTPGLLFTRSWIQWFGGLAFIVLAVSLVLGPGVAALRLSAHADRDALQLSGTLQRARQILIVYLALTAVGIAALLACGVDPFAALVYGLSAVATGGYAPDDRGLGGLPGIPAQAAVLLICLAGAVSFDLYVQLRRRRLRALTRDRAVVTLLTVTAVTTLAVFAIEGLSRGGRPSAELLWSALQLAVMAHTTAGFHTDPLTEFAPASQLLAAFAMLMGGDIGSTAGGIKILRVLIALRVLQLVLARTSIPRHGVLIPRLAGHRLHAEEIITAFSLVALYGLLVVLSWAAFVLAGYDPFAALIEVMAAVSNGGIGAGVTGPDLPAGLKAVLIFDMLAGRLEVLAILVLLYPPTWFGRRRSVR